MSTSALLETRDLSCIRNDRQLFEHLAIALEPGRMLVVEGPNGCGKTSLLRILTGLRLPDAGEVLWRGESIDRQAGDYYGQVNYVGHHDGVKNELSCVENLRLARARRRRGRNGAGGSLRPSRRPSAGDGKGSQRSFGTVPT